MSDELYEIAFSGQVAEGADPETVKMHIGRMFKADEQRLAQLFSGRRVLIKRQTDAATMAKYRGAFEKAGAICEVRPLANDTAAAAAAPSANHQAGANPGEASGEPYQSRYPESDLVPQALLSAPLDIQGEKIEELQADVAPVGSLMQHEITEPPEAEFDLNGLDVAPVGTTLATGTKETPPPLPDTSGLRLAD